MRINFRVQLLCYRNREGIHKGICESNHEGIHKGIRKGIREDNHEGIHKGIRKGIREGIRKGICEWLISPAVYLILLAIRMRRYKRLTWLRLSHTI